MSATEVLRSLLPMYLCVSAHAQTPMVTDADIARAKERQPKVTETDIRRARELNPMPSEAELRRLPTPSTPHIDALPVPPGKTVTDLSALAGGFDLAMRQPIVSTQGSSRILIFISFSMPREALSRLSDQAARAGATLLLRGLDGGSLTRTVARVQQLIGNRQVSVQIDPQAFDRYAITQAPSFVLVREGAQATSCATGLCMPSDGFAKATGDVSLDYALSFFRRSAPSFAREADAILRRLQNRSN